MTPLNTSQIKAAISINSRTIIKELYDISLRQVQGEATRQSALEGKATGLLSAIGLSMTILFTFGCQILLSATKPLAPLDKPHRIVLFAAFLLSTISALAASAHAIWALRISKDYRYVGEQNVFHEKVLSDASTHENDDDAVTEYRRWLIPSLWAAFKSDYSLHERKAAIIYRGQVCFMVFVSCLAVTAIAIANEILWKYM